MLSPNDYQHHQFRLAELNAQAARRRLVRHATHRPRRPFRPFMARLGAELIALGTRLQARYGALDAPMRTPDSVFVQERA